MLPQWNCVPSEFECIVHCQAVHGRLDAGFKFSNGSLWEDASAAEARLRRELLWDPMWMRPNLVPHATHAEREQSTGIDGCCDLGRLAVQESAPNDASIAQCNRGLHGGEGWQYRRRERTDGLNGCSSLGPCRGVLPDSFKALEELKDQVDEKLERDLEIYVDCMGASCEERVHSQIRCCEIKNDLRGRESDIQIVNP